MCNGTDVNITGSNCTNTVTGMVTDERMSRTPDERLYSSGSNDSFSFTQCYVSLGDPDGEDFAFTKCDRRWNLHPLGSSRRQLENHGLRPVERHARGRPFDARRVE